MKYDLVVVGGGTIGLAAAFNSARRGLKTALIDQDQIHSDKNSSRGFDRCFRILYSKEEKVKLAENSLTLWYELEKMAHRKILAENSLLFFGYETGHNPYEDSIIKVKTRMQEMGIPYDYFDSPQSIARAFPFFATEKFPKNYVGLLQKNAATIDLTSSFSVLKEYGLKTGNLTIYENTAVSHISREAEQWYLKITGKTNQNLKTTSLILCPGIWLSRCLKHFGLTPKNWEIWHMNYAYFKILDKSYELPIWYEFGNFTPTEQNLFYAITNLDFNETTKGMLKAAKDCTNTKLKKPEQAKKENFDAQIIEEIKNHLRHRIRKGIVDLTPQLEGACPYSVSPDGEIILGRIPTTPEAKTYFPKAAVFCDSSGRSFKFAPLYGRILVDLATQEKTSYQSLIASFSTNRPNLFNLS